MTEDIVKKFKNVDFSKCSTDPFLIRQKKDEEEIVIGDGHIQDINEIGTGFIECNTECSNELVCTTANCGGATITTGCSTVIIEPIPTAEEKLEKLVLKFEDLLKKMEERFVTFI